MVYIPRGYKYRLINAVLLKDSIKYGVFDQSDNTVEYYTKAEIARTISISKAEIRNLEDIDEISDGLRGYNVCNNKQVVKVNSIVRTRYHASDDDMRKKTKEVTVVDVKNLLAFTLSKATCADWYLTIYYANKRELTVLYITPGDTLRINIEGMPEIIRKFDMTFEEFMYSNYNQDKYIEVSKMIEAAEDSIESDMLAIYNLLCSLSNVYQNVSVNKNANSVVLVTRPAYFLGYV